MQTENPEMLTGHDLVNYLIANPTVRGNFKYDSFLSCMWRNLLIAQPGFADVANFDMIYHHDIYKILMVHPELAPHFDFSKLWDGEFKHLFLKHPELATPKNTTAMYTYTWSIILHKHPHLASVCPFKKFHGCDWVNLLIKQPSFADQCSWKKLTFLDWRRILSAQSGFLKFLRLEYFESVEKLLELLKNCYLGECAAAKGIFLQQIQDAATFLICKKMDRTNGKHYLKNKYKHQNWDFIDNLCSLSYKDAVDIYKTKLTEFYITLLAPDRVFEKMFNHFDISVRDPGGNSLLFPALISGLYSGNMARYNLLLEKGFDPDEKNLAGFSCNDLIKSGKIK